MVNNSSHGANIFVAFYRLLMLASKLSCITMTRKPMRIVIPGEIITLIFINLPLRATLKPLCFALVFKVKYSFREMHFYFELYM